MADRMCSHFVGASAVCGVPQHQMQASPNSVWSLQVSASGFWLGFAQPQALFAGHTHTSWLSSSLRNYGQQSSLIAPKSHRAAVPLVHALVNPSSGEHCNRTLYLTEQKQRKHNNHNNRTLRVTLPQRRGPGSGCSLMKKRRFPEVNCSQDGVGICDPGVSSEAGPSMALPGNESGKYTGAEQVDQASSAPTSLLPFGGQTPEQTPGSVVTCLTQELGPQDAKSLEDLGCTMPLPTFEDVCTAMFRIRDGIVRTDCTRSEALSEQTGVEVYLKHEYKQRTGSFKERGARNALMLLSSEQKAIGVVAASAGNHALGLAYHGKQLGVPVTVVMPVGAPLVKVQKCRDLGARVVQVGSDIGEAKDHAELVYVAKEGLQYINGFDHPHIVAGQGTIGLEIMEQVPDVDAVVVPVGGAGLIAGIALAIKKLRPWVEVIGVEPKNCASFQAAVAAGKPVKVSRLAPTLADGLAVPLVGSHAFAVARPRVDRLVTVREKELGLAVLRLVEAEKLVQEGAGAAGLAALLAGHLPHLLGKKVVVPLCGGNIDTTMLGRVIERGLAADDRLVRFSVNVRDSPGSIARLSLAVAEEGASIKDIVHERAWLIDDISHVQVFVVVETTGRDHVVRLQQRLESEIAGKGPVHSWGQYRLESP